MLCELRVMYRYACCTFAVLAAVILPAISAVAADKYSVVAELGVEAKMRDGTVLRADIYRPGADGKFGKRLVEMMGQSTAPVVFVLRRGAETQTISVTARASANWSAGLSTRWQTYDRAPAA